MRRLRLFSFGLTILALAAIVVMTWDRPALAVGSQIRTFVASTGSDANPCSRTAPCRTFGAALAQTAAGGEIVALDSGGYGAVTITQSVTVVAAPGVQASISPSSGNAITVNAGLSDTVVLRNLNLNGQGGSNGVRYLAGGSLHVEHLDIGGFTDNGIYMSVSGGAELYVADTVVRKNGGTGLYLTSTSATAHAVVVRLRAEKNSYGVVVSDYVQATVSESVASGNAAYGFAASSVNGPAQFSLETCMASKNGVGILAESTASYASAVVSNCTVTSNDLGVVVTTNGFLYTRMNNTLTLNTYDGSFSGTFNPM